MNEKNKTKKPLYSILAQDQKEVNALSELALDMRWSWDHSADDVWSQLDPELWKRYIYSRIMYHLTV